jgi:hypothetical protein
MTEFLTSSAPRSSFSKNLAATSIKASFGHLWNQSITTLLIKAGNYLALLLKSSPLGEKHKQT